MSTSVASPEIPPEIESLSPEDLIRWAVGQFDDQVALTTSFGIQSAVMLHLVTKVKPDVPVIWIDTGYLHPETYLYAEELSNRLDLNLHIFQSDISPARMEAVHGKLWESEDVAELDRYDQIRKVEPLRRALQDLKVEAWLTGLRSSQTDFRSRLPRVEQKSGRLKIYPILSWSSKQVYEYRIEHQLPHHPLFDRGFTTVGDWHNSREASAGDAHERDARFGGKKQECGIHVTGDGEGI